MNLCELCCGRKLVKVLSVCVVVNSDPLLKQCLTSISTLVKYDIKRPSEIGPKYADPKFCFANLLLNRNNFRGRDERLLFQYDLEATRILCLEIYDKLGVRSSSDLCAIPQVYQ